METELSNYSKIGMTQDEHEGQNLIIGEKVAYFEKNNSLIVDRKNLAKFYFTRHVTCKKCNIKFFRQNF